MENDFSSQTASNEPHQGEPSSLVNSAKEGEMPQKTPYVHEKRNIYPLVRHILLVACVLLTVCLVIFLIHQNGKSIYDNGI